MKLKQLLGMCTIVLFMSCTADTLGVCESEFLDDYTCWPAIGESSCGYGDYYHSTQSCSDLGYTEATFGTGYKDGKSFISPKGSSFPGAFGTFAANGSSGGGSFGGSGGSSSGGCSNAAYNGPKFDVQVTSFCKTAQLAKCAGDQAAYNYSCTTYKDFGSSVWTGSGSLPKCPYCN